jgi:hypothetical protein
MQWQIDHATSGHDISEWIDEQAGSVAKWPVAILSATRLEWLPEVQSDLFLVQTPSHLSANHVASLEKLIRGGQPVAVLGSFADGIEPSLLRSAGLSRSGASQKESSRPCKAVNDAPDLVLNVPAEFGTYCRADSGTWSSSSQTVYNEGGSAALTLSPVGKINLVVWNPPNLRSVEQIPLAQVWGNTGAPYALAAGALNELLRRNSSLHVGQIDLKQTMSIAAWRTKSGGIHLLAANLEEGLREDGDFSRHAALALPKSWQQGNWADIWTGRKFPARDGLIQVDLPQAASVLLELSR